MSATDIVIKLAMEGASVVGADIGSVRASMDELGGASSKLKELLGVLGVTLSVVGFASMIEGVIHSAAELEGLATQAGVTGEALSALVQVGKLSGTSAEDIASAINKMQKAMTGAAEDTGKAADALSSLGIDFDAFKAMSPDEELMAIAEKMNEFADGTGKSQIAMDLFGKTGAKFLDYLRDLAAAEDLHAKFTDEQIAQSKEYDQQLRLLTASGEAWKSELAMGMLPALQETTTVLLGVTNETGGLRDQIKALAADGTLAEWTRSAISGLSYVIDAWAGLKAVVITVGDTIGFWVAKSVAGIATFGEILAAFIAHDWNGMQVAVEEGTAKQLTLEAAHQDSFEKTWGEQTLGMKLRARLTDIAGVTAAVGDQKPQLDRTTDATDAYKAAMKEAAAAEKEAAAEARALAAEEAKADAAGQTLIANIDLKNRQLQQEVDLGRKLTDGEKELMTLRDQVSSGIATMTLKEFENAQAQSINSTNMQLGIKLMADAKTQADAYTKATEETTAAMVKKTASMAEDNVKALDHILQLTLGKEGYEQYKIAVMLADAAQLEATANTTTDTGQRRANSDQLLEQARLLRDRAGLASTGIIVAEAVAAQKAWEATTKSIGNDLTQALISGWDSGKSAFVIFRDWLEAEFVKMVLTPTINFIVSPIAGALNSMLSGWLTSLVGGSSTGGGLLGAAGGASGSGGGGILGSAGSAISNLFGGGASAGGAAAGAAGGGGAIGAVASGVTSGTAVGTDLGLLGGGGASGGAAAGGAGLDSLGALGVAGLVAAGVYVVGTALSRDADVMNFTDSADVSFGSDGSQTAAAAAPGAGVFNSAAADGLANVAAAIYHDRGATFPMNFSLLDYFDVTKGMPGTDVYLNGGLLPGGGVYAPGGSPDWATMYAAAMSVAGPAAVPDGSAAGFANGGDFMGGIRLVGERGPELELTGPSRIFDANTTASMLRSGGASGSELADELRLLREEVRGLRASVERGNEHSSRTANTLNGQQGVPLLVQVVTA